jgi:hypothetical protein
MELTEWGLHYSGGVVVVSLITHAWRQGSTVHILEGVAPAAVLENALRSVSTSSTARSRREELNGGQSPRTRKCFFCARTDHWMTNTKVAFSRNFT